MKLDVVVSPELESAGLLAADLEALGYDGLWTAETQHDPFLPLAVAATTTRRITLGTAIATAFPRSPMVTAMISWDLQRASGGRFVLGLGTQVKAHNERRFSIAFERPAPKIRETVLAIRHIWGAFQGEHPLAFRGAFYRHDLLTPFFDPGPIDHPPPPIYLAAVNPIMLRVAAEVADGVHIHPFHTLAYLREVALPALRAGLERAERTRSDLVLSAPVFAVVGSGEERARMESFVRSQLAFYGSTRTYRGVLEAHGWGELTDRLHRLMARGDVDGMPRLIGDGVLAEFALDADTWEQAAARMREKYGGILDRISVYRLGQTGQVDGVARLAAAFKEL